MQRIQVELELRYHFFFGFAARKAVSLIAFLRCFVDLRSVQLVCAATPETIVGRSACDGAQ